MNIIEEKDKLISDLQAENCRLYKANAQLISRVAQLEAEKTHYLEMLRLAQHRQFGASSEQTPSVPEPPVPEPSGVFNEAEAEADIETIIRKGKREYKKRHKPVGQREAFFNNLPTEQILHEWPEDKQICPDCGGPLHECKHDVVRRELKHIPARFVVVEHVQVVYGCRNCEANSATGSAPMVKADTPNPVIPGSGVASASLIAYIMSCKYVLGLPLYRLEQEFRRLGVDISRQTMANWIIQVAAQWLSLIFKLFYTALLGYDVLHGDETVTQTIREKGRRASQKSYMWVYVTGKDAIHQLVLFEYQSTREGKHPQTFLAEYKGFLHVDGYAAYKKLEERGVTLVLCWAHMRRKFDEAIKAQKKAERDAAIANKGLDFCNQLFALEQKYDELNLRGEERTKQRELKSKPVAEAFFSWVEETLPLAVPKSKFSQALTYAVNQRQWLMNVFLDARLELSNNRAERSIRPFAVGRKNWLFSFSAGGAKASAVVYSIVETAQANGLLPMAYLQYLLQTLPDLPKDRLHECLPWNPVVQETCKIPTHAT